MFSVLIGASIESQFETIVLDSEHANKDVLLCYSHLNLILC